MIKLTKQQEQRLTEKFRPIVKKLLNEENNNLDAQEIKAALSVINHLSATGNLRHSTNDKELIKFEDKIAELRIAMM